MVFKIFAANPTFAHHQSRIFFDMLKSLCRASVFSTFQTNQPQIPNSWKIKIAVSSQCFRSSSADKYTIFVQVCYLEVGEHGVWRQSILDTLPLTKLVSH